MEKSNKRHVGRARPIRPSVLGRATARVPSNRRIDARGVATSSPRAVARVKPAATAEPVDPATEILQSPDVTAAIFVDGSGRRGRRLRMIAYALVVLALMLILAFWVIQGLDVFGSPF
ncbi:hypothetical protein Q2K19_22910 [Micromonospora soli]|uniref:hypothetical protein n=1 Tax=Micromonospora sp. NBRC 110009 TaxID=3061627 RepID=UPI00267294BF|nr:hypothetical protein [Micromonospora sp. NBRC 110009]WKT97014.1 hypothetical protein Q2K19_22910 [Micromonospora sp. NBRC 110009]